VDTNKVRGSVTPLVIASELGHVDVVRELLAPSVPVVGMDPRDLPGPANPFHVTSYGSTALHIAAENGHAR
jgi:ankyrin repeat protein